MPPGDDRPEIRFVEATPATAPTAEPPDLPAEPPVSHLLRNPRLIIGVLVAVLAIGAGLGYISGKHSAKKVVRVVTAAPSPTSSAPAAGSSVLAATGSQCATRTGTQLQLGIEILNATSKPLTIDRVATSFPLNGLRASARLEAVAASFPGPARTLPGSNSHPGQPNWITVTVQVLVACPGPLPVDFEVRYTQDGRTITSDLGGFSDLGGVPYPGCTTPR